MHKENEIFRNYEIEEFIFDDCIKEQVKELIDRYRSDFRVNKDSNFFVRDLTMEFRWIPLFEELKYFYNNDVCISCVICISIMKSTKYNLRTFAYYYENAVHRIEETWEYVHILLAEILDLELFVGKDIRDANIKYCSGTWDFSKSASGYKAIFHPYKGKQLKEANEAAEKDNVLLNISVNREKSVFHKVLRKKMSLNERIAKIIELYFSEEACEIHRIRNELVHRRSLGSRFSVGPCIIGSGQAININPNGWFEFRNKEVLIEKNLSIIREVLQTIQDIIFNHDLPNTKENENQEFFLASCVCPSCKENVVIPREMYEYFKEKKLKVPCPCCGKNGLNTNGNVPVDDRLYYQNFWQYNETIVKYAKTMFENED
mgnify:FL=1|jgi:hypothetical protein